MHSPFGAVFLCLRNSNISNGNAGLFENAFGQNLSLQDLKKAVIILSLVLFSKACGHALGEYGNYGFI